MGSPDPSAKYISGCSAGMTSPSVSELDSEGQRQVSEIYSKSDDYLQPNRGLYISGTATSQGVVSELDGDHAPRQSEIRN